VKKLITICLVCVLTTAASQGMLISFDENGKGDVDGTPLVYGIGEPPIGHPTLYYELPATIVEGDAVLYEPQSTSEISDILRFLNVQGATGGLTGRVYVYSERELDGVERDLADTGIPDWPWLDNRWGTYEQGIEGGWNGLVITLLDPAMAGYMEGGVTYNFTSDVPEPATICLLGLGTLSLIRKKRA
jgi:hypothetical protein